MKLDRTDKEDAREVFEFLLPDERIRPACIELLAKSIQMANQSDADRWGVSLFPDFIRMNVGRIEVLYIGPDIIRINLDSETLPHFSPELEVEIRNSDFKHVPNATECTFPAEQAESLLPQVQESQAKLLQKAARTYFQQSRKDAHSTGVIEYLKDYLNQPLPQPAYIFSSPETNAQMLAMSSQDDEAEELPDIEQERPSAIEGHKEFVNHLRRERKPWIIKAKKNQVLNETGKLACEACGFDFKQVYGEFFAEAHHRALLAAVETEIETTLDDLSILCSNCHRMIHRTKPMETVEQFRERVTRFQNKPRTV